MGNLVGLSAFDDYDIYDHPIQNKGVIDAKDEKYTLHRIKTTDKQIAELGLDVKKLDEIIDVYTKVIIGGSRALKIWTGREFNVDDNDIFLHSIEGNRFNGKLEKDIEQLMRIFPNCSIRVQLAKENTESIVNEEQLIEEFDQAIIGTINLKYENKKYQFVMIEQNPGYTYSVDLVGWYGKTSDLPVFILCDKFEPIPNFIVKEGHEHWLSKQGILLNLRHKNRIEKYEKKGFKFINIKNEEAILSLDTIYNSSIDVDKYNSV